MSKESNIQHVQTLMFKSDIEELERLTKCNNKKDAISASVEAFLELRPVKQDGRWIVPCFPIINSRYGEKKV